MKEQHLVSWNVNGVRAIVKKDFLKDVEAMDPDVLCLQETKAQSEDAQTTLSLLGGYHIYTNSSKERKGYSGTAILSKEKPREVHYDLGVEAHDQEGRVITASFEQYHLVTVYTPNSGEGMKRLSYRQKWDEAFRQHIAELQQTMPVIICGDLNVAHTEIDLARPKANYDKTSGYTQAEIDGLDNLLSLGLIDTFRMRYPDEVKYSWWNYKYNARDRNVGWRIDYFLASEELRPNIEDSLIYNEYMGSDHCPVALKLKL